MENSSKLDPEGSSPGPLNFHGMVRDTNGRAVEGATVMLFASITGGIERSLGSTLTDNAGSYSISIPQPPDYGKFLGFKLRAGKTYVHSETLGAAETKKEADTNAPPDKYDGDRQQTGSTPPPGPPPNRPQVPPGHTSTPRRRIKTLFR